MEIFWATFQAVAMIMIIGSIGFIVLARKMVPLTIVEVLTPIIIDIAAPCLVFSKIILNFDPDKIKEWYYLPLWWAGSAFVFSAIGMIAKKTFQKNGEEFGISLFYPNAIFIPLALIPELFGVNSSIVTEHFIFTLFFPAFLFNTYFLFFGKQKNNAIQWSKIFNPILIGTVLAVFLKITKLYVFLPMFFVNATKHIGNMALPLIILLVGGNIFIDFQNKGTFDIRSVVYFVCIKNILIPIIALCLIVLIKPPMSAAVLIFILSIVPPVTTIPILASKIKLNVFLINQFLLGSFFFQ